MHKTILVNASGTKFGGAKTIIDTYLHWIINNNLNDEFVFILGYQPDLKLSRNIKVIVKPTSGIATFLFSTITIIRFVLKFKPSKLISFNNVNLLIPCVERITYFHQTKLFEPTFSIKKVLYNFAIKRLKKSKFITQSELVKSLFLKKYPGYNVIVKWPGFSVPLIKGGDVSKFCEQLREQGKRLLLVPITDIRMSHKNFALIFQYSKLLNELNIDVIVTSNQYQHSSKDNIHFVGKLERNEIFNLYRIVDGVLFPSNAETVGLPIFEAASNGLPVWVLSKPYSKFFYQHFGEPKNIILFEEHKLIDHLHFDGRYTEKPTNKYSNSDWNFI